MPRPPVLILLGASLLAGSAQASYGQMRLDGLGLLLAFALTIGWAFLVDVGVLIRIFRYRAALVIGFVVALAVVAFLLSQLALPRERTGFFNGAPGGAQLVLLVVTSAVLIPFVFVAPVAQHLAERAGRRAPGWITAWMLLQLALPPGFLVLGATDHYFWQREYAAAQADGRAVRAGGLSGILERAEQRHERIWGTGWSYPWRLKPPPGAVPRASGFMAGLAKGVDASALIAASEPLGAADRAALRALMEGYFLGNAVRNIRAKLLWDALEPGRFAKQLAPQGVAEASAVNEEVLPVLLERLEKHGEARLCPGGRMAEADRAVLNALVQAKGRVWSVEKRDYEMRPDWDGYPKRVERLCSG